MKSPKPGEVFSIFGITPKPSRRLKIAAAATLLLLATGGLLIRHYESSPLFHGQPLAHWEQANQRERAFEAIREAGPEDVPFLAHAALSPPTLWQRTTGFFWTRCAPKLPGRWISKLEPPAGLFRSPPLSQAALDRLHQLGPEAREAVPALSQVLQGTNHWHRVIAAICLGNIASPDKRAVRALLRAARDENLEIRILAIRALGNIGNESPRILPALLQMRDEQDSSVLVELGVSLWKTDESPANAIPLFYRAIRSDTSWSGWGWVQKLEDIGEVEVVPILVEVLLQHPEPRIRARAAMALGNLGPLGAGAKPGLEQAARDDEYLIVRDWAKAALANIGPESKLLRW